MNQNRETYIMSQLLISYYQSITISSSLPERLACLGGTSTQNV